MPKIKAIVTNIRWDVDEPSDLDHLPSSMELTTPVDYLNSTPDVDEIEEAAGDQISDEITNKTGFCHKGYDVTYSVVSVD